MGQTPADELRSGRGYLGIFGLGYIGYSTAAYYGKAGIRVLGYDPVPERVEALNTGRSIIPNLDLWLGFPTTELPVAGTEDVQDLRHDNVVAHFVAVPTEKDGEPWDIPLMQVMDTLRGTSGLVIVESTLTLGMAEKARSILGRDFAIANRRDWFGNPAQNLASIPRIVGSPTPVMTSQAADVCRIVTQTVHETGFREAILVKALENAMRFLDICLVNEMTMAYPSVDIREVARLAGTKWNVQMYFPGIPGGYCLPLAGQYLLEGSKDKATELSLLGASSQVPARLLAQAVHSIEDSGARKIAVLGLTYKEDIPVSVLSGGVWLARALQTGSRSVVVHDPYFLSLTCQDLTGCPYEPFPAILKHVDTVVLFSGHRAYGSLPDDALHNALTEVKRVLDFSGLWERRTPEWVDYRLMGRANWVWKPGVEVS